MANTQIGKTTKTTGLTQIEQRPKVNLKKRLYSNLTDLELAAEVMKYAQKESEQVPLLETEIRRRKRLQARLNCPVDVLPSLPQDSTLYFSDLPSVQS